jgi:hypothetical protein
MNNNKDDKNKGVKRVKKAIQPKSPNKIGRDTKAINKKIPVYNDTRVDEGIDLSELMTPQDIEELNSITPNSKLTEREEKLIMIFLAYPKLEKWKIAQMAGYKCSSKSAFNNAFNMVMEKYDCAGDHKRIFRQVGFGEARIAMRIRELALHSKSDQVALNACALAAKCLDMTKTEIDLVEGFGVIVNRPSTQAEPSKTGPELKVATGGRKPVAISK